jgi:TIR domain
VCYAREDQDFVRALIVDLRARGLSIFVDADIEPGADWDRTIDERLRTCAKLLIVLSPAAVGSAEVRGELRIALNLAKPIVPLLLVTCETPRQLQNIQYLDFRSGDTAALREALATVLRSRHREDFGDWHGLARVVSRDLRNRQDLLDDVKSEAAGRLLQSLHSKALNVLKEQQPGQVTRAWDADVKVPHERATKVDPDARIAQVFDDDVIAGKLLILGAPGSGKTITLLELCQELIVRAEHDVAAPIPVLCNLSSWRHDGRAFAVWLVGHLKEKYGVRKDHGRAWLDERALVPLLDGLDEVAPENQEACVRAINQFQQDCSPRHIVVCCRLDEYENYQVKLHLNGAIRLLPLADGQIRSYLAHAESTVLWDAVSGDAETMALARSPLLLRVMTVAYEETSTGDWHRLTSASERQAHLFDVYVQRLLNDNAATAHFSKTHTVRWLAWLARAMKGQGQPELLIEQMQPTWLESAAQRLLYRCGVFALVASAFALAIQLNLWLFNVPRGTIGDAFSHMVGATQAGAFWQQHDSLAVAIMGLAAGLTVAAQRRIRPIETLMWSWTNGWHGMVAGLRRFSIGGLNHVAYVGLGIALLASAVPLKSMVDADQLSPELVRFNVAGYVVAAAALCTLAAAILRTMRPGAWLVGGADRPPRGSAVDTAVSGLVFAAASSLNMGPLIAAAAGISIGSLVRICGGSSVLSAARFADTLVVGLASGLSSGAISWGTETVRRGFVDAVGVWMIGGIGVATTVALGVGVFGGFRHPQMVTARSTSERARNLARALVLGVIIGVICGLIVMVARRTGGMPLVRGVVLASARIGGGWTVGLLEMATITAIAAFLGIFTGGFLGALFGMLRGLTGPDVQRRTTPNQGIRQSARNIGVFALVGALIVGLPYGLMNLTMGAVMTRAVPSAWDWVNFVAAPAVWFGLMGALVPGSACVQHFALRFVFWCFGVIPLRYARFLNYATDRMLLQRIGGRYRFIHGLLREHFAAMQF